jgi:hypothetical protein
VSWRAESVWFALAVACAIGVGLFVHWPSLGSGFRGDDYPQRSMVRGEFPVPRSPFDLFDFSSGARADVQRLSDFGYLPWWSEPDLRLRMWRPIASGLIAWDHHTFGDDARWHHAHSLAWYVLLLLAASRLFRRSLSPPAAALATLLFALEEGHTVPIGWLANRSTLIATALGLLALSLHVSVRDGAHDGNSRRRVLVQLAVALCTSLALLSGEYAFTALAYAFAFECLRREPIRQRLLASLPVLLPTAAYLLLHRLVGATITGSGYYLSPLRDPIAYGQAALLRLPALFADLLLGLPAEWFNGSGPFRNYLLSLDLFPPDVWRQSPGWSAWHAAIGYLSLGLGYVVLRLTSSVVPPAPEPSPLASDRRRWLQVLGLGSLLALLPAAGSLPGDRLIVAAAFGVAGVVATLLVHGWPPLSALLAFERRAWLRALVALVLLGISLRAGLRVAEQAEGFAFGADAQRSWALGAELPERGASDAHVYLLSTTDFTTAANLPFIRSAHGKPLPRVYRRLCPAAAPIDVIRSGARSLQIRVLSSDLQGSAVPSLYRGEDAWIRTGEHFRLPGLFVTVLQAREGNPATMQFDFDLDLDDPRLWLMPSTMQGLRRIPAPAVGERTRLPLPLWGDLRVHAPPRAGSRAETPGIGHIAPPPEIR